MNLLRTLLWKCMDWVKMSSKHVWEYHNSGYKNPQVLSTVLITARWIWIGSIKWHLLVPPLPSRLTLFLTILWPSLPGPSPPLPAPNPQPGGFRAPIPLSPKELRHLSRPNVPKRGPCWLSTREQLAVQFLWAPKGLAKGTLKTKWGICDTWPKIGQQMTSCVQDQATIPKQVDPNPTFINGIPETRVETETVLLEIILKKI